jgi:hypothetical protein
MSYETESLAPIVAVFASNLACLCQLLKSGVLHNSDQPTQASYWHYVVAIIRFRGDYAGSALLSTLLAMPEQYLCLGALISNLQSDHPQLARCVPSTKCDCMHKIVDGLIGADGCCLHTDQNNDFQCIELMEHASIAREAHGSRKPRNALYVLVM